MRQRGVVVAVVTTAVLPGTGPGTPPPNEEVHLYQKPKLERFGAFRELTRVGTNNQFDGFTINGNDGCDFNNAFGITRCS